jgi:CRISPR-associated protein Csx14
VAEELVLRFDPLNPGQYFACCGLLDLLSRAKEGVMGHFQVSAATPREGKFVLAGVGRAALKQLLLEIRGGIYSPHEHAEQAIAPVQARIGERQLELDWWLEVFHEGASRLKCWGGQVTSEKLFRELARLIDPEVSEERLFDAGAPTKSKFGVDPRSAWNALDFGYSPNEHSQDAATYPAVEMLAALGLQGFRPVVETGRVVYCAWGAPLPVNVARLAAFAPWEGLPVAAYSFEIAKRGQGYKFFKFASLMTIRRYFR